MSLLEVFRRQCYHGENFNGAVAAYVTTQVRFKIYGYLSKLEESVLYCDIDSVIYFQKVDDAPKVTIGTIGATSQRSWRCLSLASS
jgi:hypothetical protein